MHFSGDEFCWFEILFFGISYIMIGGSGSGSSSSSSKLIVFNYQNSKTKWDKRTYQYLIIPLVLIFLSLS